MRRYLPVGFWIGVRAGLDPYNINDVKCSLFPHDNVHNDNDMVVPSPCHARPRRLPLPTRRIAAERQWPLLSCI